jgi:hypothetical protein
MTMPEPHDARRCSPEDRSRGADPKTSSRLLAAHRGVAALMSRVNDLDSWAVLVTQRLPRSGSRRSLDWGAVAEGGMQSRV